MPIFFFDLQWAYAFAGLCSYLKINPNAGMSAPTYNCENNFGRRDIMGVCKWNELAGERLTSRPSNNEPAHENILLLRQL